jgi:hypothetical protein
MREQLVVRVCRKVERMEAAILRRDSIETLVAVAAAFSFGLMVLSVESFVYKLGAAIIVVGACYITCKLHHTRTVRAPSQLDNSVREFCKTEMERADRQIHLLRTVLWWYISPILIGANLVFVGGNGLGLASVTYCVLTLLVSWWLYALNQKAVAKSLLPVRDELSELLRQLDETT